MNPPYPSASPIYGKDFRGKGFSLVELLVAMAVMSLMMLCLVTLTDQTSRLWRRASGQIETFRAARAGYEAMTREISQATLNTYQDLFGYANSGSTTLVTRTTANATTFIPVVYQRQSELRFICGPSASLIPSTWSNTVPGQLTPPLRPGHCIFVQTISGYTESSNYSDLNNLLNTRGFYVEYTSGKGLQPAFLTSGAASSSATLVSNRFRLMELIEPSELFRLYAIPTGKNWFQGPLLGGPAPAWSTGANSGTESYSRVVAENVLALILLPKITPRDAAGVFPGKIPEAILAPHYSYDSSVIGEAANYGPAAQAGMVNSKNQLPPVVQITMVAIDQASADRLNVIAAQQGVTPVQILSLDTLFCNTNDMAESLLADLAKLEDKLRANHLTYRIFTSDIMIQSAKWSSAQKN